jgi:hypothetical protein
MDMAGNFAKKKRNSQKRVVIQGNNLITTKL